MRGSFFLVLGGVLLTQACGLDLEGSASLTADGGQAGKGGGAGAAAAGKGGSAGGGGSGGSAGSAAGVSGSSGQGGGGQGGSGGTGASGVGGGGGGGQGGSGAGGSGAGGSAGAQGGSAGASGAGAGGAAGGAGGEGGASGSAPVECTSGEQCPEATACGSHSCVGGKCVLAPVGAGTSCDSNEDKCDGTAFCDGNGACVAQPPKAIEDDGNACTDDGCDPSTGQPTHTVKPGCQPCKSAAECPEPGPCRAATCEGGTCGEQLSAKGAPCDDGNKCNGNDSCDGAGVCEPGPLDLADDNNGCTTDSCDPATGKVQNDPIVCDPQSCSAGKQVSWACDPAQAKCVPTETSCGKLDCVGNACALGCQPGNPTGCPQGKICAWDGVSCGAPLGAGCGNDGECASGICERAQDKKVCAAQHCGTCMVIKGSGTGCEPADQFTDPKDECDFTENGCTSFESCNGGGACRKLDNGSLCSIDVTKKCSGGQCK